MGKRLIVDLAVEDEARFQWSKVGGNTDNTGNILVYAVAVNWQLATKMVAEPETGNKRLL
jgi:hypothetical protein